MKCKFVYMRDMTSNRSGNRCLALRSGNKCLAARSGNRCLAVRSGNRCLAATSGNTCLAGNRCLAVRSGPSVDDENQESDKRARKGSCENRRRQKMAKMGASLPLESLAEGVAKHLDGVAGCGNVDYTLNGAKMLQSLAPVMFDMQRAKGLHEMITSMDYYKLQKTWVLEKMKSTSSNSCCAVVSKKAVAKKIKDVVVKSWPEVYGSDVLRGMPSEMDDVFTLQFGQRFPSTANIWSRPEMNAPMFLVLLEGEMSVGGFPCKHVKGNTLAEHVKELEKMTANNVAKLVQKVGWLVHRVQKEEK